MRVILCCTFYSSIVSTQIKASNNLIVLFPMFGLDICLSKCIYFMVSLHGSNIVTSSSKC